MKKTLPPRTSHHQSTRFPKPKISKKLNKSLITKSSNPVENHKNALVPDRNTNTKRTKRKRKDKAGRLLKTDIETKRKNIGRHPKKDPKLKKNIKEDKKGDNKGDKKGDKKEDRKFFLFKPAKFIKEK